MRPKVERLNTPPCEIGVKRLYLPFVVRAECPTCGEIAECDLSGDYLSYPTPGVPYTVRLACYNEEGDETCFTDVDVVLNFTLRAKNVRVGEY